MPLKEMDRDESLLAHVPKLIEVVALLCAEERILYATAWRVFVAAPAAEKANPVPGTKLLFVPDWLAETSTAKIRMSWELVVLSGPLVMLVGARPVGFTGPAASGEEAAAPEIS